MLPLLIFSFLLLEQSESDDNGTALAMALMTGFLLEQFTQTQEAEFLAAT